MFYIEKFIGSEIIEGKQRKNREIACKTTDFSICWIIEFLQGIAEGFYR
jgi:hypothetical protein